jgi:hypothetical protein
MNREKAKELAALLTAYANGADLQYEAHNEWTDMKDGDAIVFCIEYGREMRVKQRYNEIFKLKSMLEENHIPFEWIEHNDLRNGYQICYPEKDGKRVCSVIEHSFSYGSQEDLLEIQGLLTADEEKCDSVLGNLTAGDVFQRILSHWEKTKRIYLENPIYRPFKSCDELVYYWEREKVGYSPNPLQMIDIWVKHKVDGRRRMIVGFGENFVEVGVKAKPITLERLFETYTFLDGGPCGVKETGII